MQHAFRRIAIVTAALWQPAWALAYGPEGHAMVADMAEHHLTEAAGAEVRRLLSLEGHLRLDEVSSWPDAIRTLQPATGPAHYVDIPLAATAYDAARDCHDDGKGGHPPELACLAAKLPYYVGVLAQPRSASTDAARLEALKWVVHLVGDAHQPLHAEDNGDIGGNNVKLTYFGANVNLHLIWDTAIIEHNYAWKAVGPPDYDFDHRTAAWAADRLDERITPAQRSAWASSSAAAGDVAGQVLGWVMESHALAADAYARSANRPLGWEPAYQDYAWPVISDELKKASVRLALLLNGALR